MATINYWFMLQHRRLRGKFSMSTIERHQDRLMAALEKRHAKVSA